MNLNAFRYNFSDVNKSSNFFAQNFSVSILTKANMNNSSLPFFNRNFDKKRLKLLFSWYYANRGENAAFSLVETLQKLGFTHAMKAGISLGIDDLQVPPTKKKAITEAVESLNITKNSVYSGDVMALEEFQQFVDIWHRTSEQLKTAVVQNFTKSSFNSIQNQCHGSFWDPKYQFNIKQNLACKYLTTKQKTNSTVTRLDFTIPVNNEQPFHYFGNTLNPVYMMAFSGARGNLSQVRQLVGMRGLMADPQGQLVEFPIQSNFREGLTVTEYMISCYGARKGLVDTALRTAAAGYLTRRLVDVAHHQIVRFVTCGTKGGIWLSTQINKKIQQSQDVVLPSTWKVPLSPFDIKNKQFVDKNQSLLTFNSPKLFKIQSQHNKSSSSSKINETKATIKESDIEEKKQFIFTKQSPITRCIGRVLARDIPGVAFRNQEIDITLGSLPLLRKIYDTVGIYVRSPLTCKSETGICQLCYGWSVSANRLVGLGEAVGIIAAQSIGEPGTQLTMRTFHTGGVFSGDIMEECRAKHGGIVFFQGLYLGLMVRTAGGAVAFCIKTPGTLVIRSKEDLTTYHLSANSLLFVRQGETVLMNSLLAQIPNLPEIEENTGESTKTIYSSFSGEIRQTSTVNNALGNIRILAGQQNVPIYISPKQTYPYVSETQTSINNKLVRSCKVIKGKSRWYQNSNNLKFSDVHPFHYSLNSVTGLDSQKDKVLFMYPGVHRLGQTTANSKGSISSFYYKLRPLKHNNLTESLETKQITPSPLNLLNNSKYRFNRPVVIKQLQMPFTSVTTLLEGGGEATPLVHNFDSLSSQIKSLLKKREFFNNKYECSIIMTQFLPYIQLDIKKALKLNAISINFKCFSKTFETLDRPWSFFARYKPIFNPESSIKTKFNQTHWIEPEIFNDFSRENQNIPLGTGPIDTIIVSNRLLKLDLKLVINFFQFAELKNYAYLFWTKWSIIFLKSYTAFLVLDIVKKKNKTIFNSKQPVSHLYKLQITRNLRHKIFSFRPKNEKNKKSAAINKKNSKLKPELILRERGVRLSQTQVCISSPAPLDPLAHAVACSARPLKFNYNQGRFYNSRTFVRLQNTSKTITRFTFSSSICYYLQKNITYFLAQKTKGSKHHFLHSLQPQRPNDSVRISTNEKDPLFKSGEVFPIQSNNSIQDFKKTYSSKVDTSHISGFLTHCDRISYKLPQEPFTLVPEFNKKPQDLLLQIGGVVNTGDELVKNYGSTSCGQVIEKSFSVVTLRFTQNILYSNFKFRPAKVSPNVQNGKWLPKGTPLVTLPYISSVTGDIVAGIPKIEQLFEARGEALQEIVDKIWHSYNSLIVPKSKAVRECFKEIGLFLVGAIQKVYSSQGVHIADKHLEVIIRQMTKRVLITDPGDTEFLTDEFVDINTIECVNWTTYGEMASYRPHLIGITKVSLNSNSFLSSASFQQTARVLERETFLEKTDRLLGLKERVMMGAVINAGTGSFRTDVFLAKVRKKSLSSDTRNLFKNLSFFSRRVIEQNR